MKNSTVLLTSANFFTIAKFRYALVSKLISNGCKVVLYSSDDEMSQNSIFKLEQLGAICIKTGNGMPVQMEEESESVLACAQGKDEKANEDDVTYTV